MLNSALAFSGRPSDAVPEAVNAIIGSALTGAAMSTMVICRRDATKCQLHATAQAIDGPGDITIRTRSDPAAGLVVVEISDTGSGIAPEHLGKIFDPGFTTKGVGVGTGLGLAISYRIVAGHRGKIEVESTLGRGTTFRIILPAGSATGHGSAA